MLVSARDISKDFGGVRALRSVSVDIRRGAIHGLIGENGAGKSTLGKILGGAIAPDAGDLYVRGERVAYRSPREALADGIAVIQQELALVPHLTVLENVFLGNESARIGVVDSGRALERFAALRDSTGFELEPGAVVRNLSTAQQQQVEILRALSREVDLIVMDEPTSSLGRQDADKLHRIVLQLRDRGLAVVYVSHFLEDVLELADDVTVLRNGELVETRRAAALTVDEVVPWMLGRAESRVFPRKHPVPADAPVRLSVQELTGAGMPAPVSFDVRAGEILGLAGLVGSGRTEIARAVCGADRYEYGRVMLDGRELDQGAPWACIRAGLVLVPESRKEQGLVLSLSQMANVTLPHLSSLTQAGVLRPRAERARVRDVVKRVGSPVERLDERVTRLSGGNQQKVVFAKWLYREPRVMVLDEPTRGIDVGAKFNIYNLIVELARHGMAVVLISSEMEEVVGLSHRVLVMRRGAVVDSFEGAAISTEAVTRAALGAGEGRGRAAHV